MAAAHNQCRRLYVGTTHMDAQALVVWNMGAIDDSGHPQALDLFRKVVLASSSIPVAFPPVFIEVEVDGRRYDEMHTDGGTVTQLFFYAGTVDLHAARAPPGARNAMAIEAHSMLYAMASWGPGCVKTLTATHLAKNRLHQKLVELRSACAKWFWHPYLALVLSFHKASAGTRTDQTPPAGNIRPRHQHPDQVCRVR